MADNNIRFLSEKNSVVFTITDTINTVSVPRSTVQKAYKESSAYLNFTAPTDDSQPQGYGYNYGYDYGGNDDTPAHLPNFGYGEDYGYDYGGDV